MKKLQFVLLIYFFVSYVNIVSSQTQYTPYDDIPGITKSYKPVYNKNYPDWAKKLYIYPVNFLEICQEFDTYRKKNKDEKNSIIRYFKIWRKYVAPYVNSKGEIKIPDLNEIHQRLYNSQKNSSSIVKSSANNTRWSLLGPVATYGTAELCCDMVPWQVNISSFDVSESDKNIIYCGTETGFVNKTEDNGKTWNQVGINYPFGSTVNTIAINRNNSDTVYVAAGLQVHKTCDGGTSWEPMLEPSELFDADRLKIDRSNQNKIIAATRSGIFISFDAGRNWIKKWDHRTFDLEFCPDSTNIIYGITKDVNNYFQLVVSNDGGENFFIQNEFPKHYQDQEGALLAVTNSNPDILFATLLSKEGDESVPFILKGTSSNGIFTWEEIKKGEYGSVGGLAGFTNGQGYFDLVLEVSPNDENIVFWGTCSLWKSIDGGISFTKVGGYGGDFNIHPDIQDMQILNNGDMWVSTDGGMNYSTDYFSNINNYKVRIIGLVGSDFWGFDQGWNEDIVVGGRYHNGNTAIADFYEDKALRLGGGESATGWILKGKSRHAAFNDIYDGNGIILPKTYDKPIEGTFIFSKYPNMDEYGGLRGNLLHHTLYYNWLYLGEGNGFWRSKDIGTTFELLHTFPDHVGHMQISYSDPNVIYADVRNHGIYKTTDGGLTWIHKSSLTSNYVDEYWTGRLTLEISPYDPNRIYAVLQNGAWSKDIGKVFLSDDGGDSWTDWTGCINGHLKNVVIQPTCSGEDLVYLFTSSRNSTVAKAFYRYASSNEWIEYGDDYPAGMDVKYALPFFRDGKIRVAGNCGVWEAEMFEPDFCPIIMPWVDKKSPRSSDTLFFNDHSMLNHRGVTWKWEFSPEPLFVSDNTIRNPKVVFGTVDTFDVNLTVYKNGEFFSKTVHDMINVLPDPSLSDCCNPAIIPVSEWRLLYADSEQPGKDSIQAAFDGDISTFWHTEWWPQTPSHPHEIQIDMGQEYNIAEFTYVAWQDNSNGRIKDYELYISMDTVDWGEPVSVGTFVNSRTPQTIYLNNNISGRYFRLVALSEVNGNPYTTIAELSVKGCFAEIEPSIECGSEIVLSPNSDEGSYRVEGVELDPSVGESCVGGNIINDYNGSNSLNGAEFEAGNHQVLWTVTNREGLSNICTQNITVNVPTSVDNTKLSKNIEAFPNPTNNIININFPYIEIQRYKIFSSEGELINETELQGLQDKIQINLNHMVSGLYIIELIDSNGIKFKVKTIKN